MKETSDSLLAEFVNNPEILFYDSNLCWSCSGRYKIGEHEPECLLSRARTYLKLPIMWGES